MWLRRVIKQDLGNFIQCVNLEKIMLILKFYPEMLMLC